MKLLTEFRTQTIALMRGGKRAAASPGTRVESRALGCRLRALLRSADQGGALVEFALVVPMLLMVMTAIFSFGLVMNSQITLTNGVGVAAQHLQSIASTTTDPCADTLTAIAGAAPGLTKSKITLTLTMNGNVVQANTCSGDQSYLVTTTPVTVQASYPCTLPIFKASFSSACQLNAQVTEYVY